MDNGILSLLIELNFFFLCLLFLFFFPIRTISVQAQLEKKDLYFTHFYLNVIQFGKRGISFPLSLFCLSISHSFPPRTELYGYTHLIYVSNVCMHNVNVSIPFTLHDEIVRREADLAFTCKVETGFLPGCYRQCLIYCQNINLSGLGKELR